MRVVIVGGRSRADYLMGALAETVDTVVAINDDRRFCEYLSSRHDGTVIWGNGMKLAVLEEAGVAGFDAIVALTGLDADNLAICQVAKKFLGIRIQLCIVSNPENTAIFRQLGVTAAISATATLAQAIRGALELPDPVGAKARAATAAAVTAAEAGNGEGNGADGTTDDEEDPGAPSPFRSILGSWHHLGKERR